MLRIEDVPMRKSMLAVASHASVIPAGSSLSEAHAISALSALAQPTAGKARADRRDRRRYRGHDWRAAQHPLDAPRHPGARWPATQFARRPHHHLSVGRRRGEVRDHVSGQRLLRRASGALQFGCGRCRSVLRAGVYEGGFAPREEGRRQAQKLIVGTGHDLDDLGNGRSDRRTISERTRGGERRP
jgi:hypothetical protein